MSHRWKELQDYLVWKGTSWQEALCVLISIGFLMGVIGVVLFVVFDPTVFSS